MINFLVTCAVIYCVGYTIYRNRKRPIVAKAIERVRRFYDEITREEP